jgi:UDP-glucose 4-epimerase
VSASEVIAVTGIRSFIGRGTIARLLADEPAPRIVGLDRRRPFRLDERIHFHALDLTQPTADGRLAEIFEKERVDTVLHAAFRTDPTPDLELDHELETIGSLHVMHACAAARIRRLVVASSTMLYGPRPDNPNFLSEEHPLRGHPESHTVRDRVEMETLLADWMARHLDTSVCVLRPCWIMGPTFWNQVVRYFAWPIVPKPMGYDPLLQFVHENDVLDVFANAARTPRSGRYNIVARGVLPLSMLLHLAGKRVLPLPSALLDRIAYYPSQGQTGDAPAAFYDYLRYLWVADGQRGWDAFGEPVYSTREAWISFMLSRRMRRYR